MKPFFLEAFWTPDGIQRHARIVINRSGLIRQIDVDVKAEPGDIKLSGLTLPGFVNGHSHVHQRIIAGETEYRAQAQDDFWTWREAMYQAINKLDEERLFECAQQTYAEMLSVGYTSVVEFHYVHHLPGGLANSPNEIIGVLVDAAESVGIRLIVCPVLYQHGGLDSQPLSKEQKCFYLSDEAFVRLVDDLVEQYANHVLVHPALGFHSLRAVSVDTIKKIAARFPALPKHIHISEQPKEVSDVKARYQMTPIQYLAHHVSLDPSWTLIHATHASAEEFETCHREDVSVCLCPTTEANLGDGFAPIGRLLDEGIAFGFGSDSHVALDPFEEVRLAEYTERLRTGRRLCCTTEEVLSPAQLLLSRWSEAGGRMTNQPLGCIEVGHYADWVNFDTSIDNYILERLFFKTPSLRPRHVIVGGRLIGENA